MERSLERIANDARIKMFEAFAKLGGGHYGACLSVIEALTYLYFREMKVDPANPQWEERDRFVLSKGHAGFGLYSILIERGFMPAERFAAYENGVMLPKHADKHRVPGVEVSTGSLGQGLSIATGMALSAKRDNSGVRVFTLMGDGECNEGQIWEAAMAAAKYKLDNLIGIMDCNALQFDGWSKDVMPMDPLDKKWESFGWHAINVADGHDFKQLEAAFNEARTVVGKPVIIISRTVKGKGISFMEGVCSWHGGACTPEQVEQGLKDLGK